MATTWYINLLGPFQLQVNDHRIQTDRWVSKKALALFELLVTSKHKQLARDQLLVALWPGEQRDNARKRLHSTVYFLRQELAPFADDTPVITYAAGTYRFQPSGPCVYDTDRFAALCRQASDTEAIDGTTANALYLQAISLYRGRYLAHQPLQPTIGAQRAHFHDLYVRAIVKAGTFAADSNDIYEALRIFRSGLVHDPLHEHIHKALIKTLLAAGRYGEATQHFRTFRKQLWEQYGVEPSPVLLQLMNGNASPEANRAKLQCLPDNAVPAQTEATTATVVQVSFSEPVNASRRRQLTNMLSRHLRYGDSISWLTDSDLGILLPRTNPRRGPAIRSRVGQLLEGAHDGSTKVAVRPAYETSEFDTISRGLMG